MKQPTIILASSSPRRKELLAGLGVSFITHSSEVDEVVEDTLSPAQIVEQLALRKASAVASCYNEGIVIGSDTIVVFEDQILGKPANDDEAFSMLSALQGRSHYVYTGLALIDTATGKTEIRHEHTEVSFRALTDAEIHAYIASGEPRDKAGAYGIQGLGATLVKHINGDYFTVVGLPLQRLAELLQLFGVNVLQIKQD